MRRLLSISLIVMTALAVPVVARGDPPPLSGSLEFLQSQEARIAGKVFLSWAGLESNQRPWD